ncbi:unnamed protein product, partial [Cuscuta campestris]
MATAVDLGRELVRRKIRLTYGGGNVGLQGAVASTIYTNGGIVRGFILGYIAARQVYGPTYGAEYTVSRSYYKHFEMNHVVNAFIVLPGGVDPMEGLFTLISWASEGLHSKPIGLLNIDGYLNNLIKFLDDAMANNNTNNLALRSILDKDKLNGTNFVDWQRNLYIVLHMDEKEYVLEKPIPPAPPANAPKAVKDAYEKHVKDDNQVSCVMLATMITELQKQHEDMKAHEMIVALRQQYQGQSSHEHFLMSKALFSCKLSSGNPKELATYLILQSLPELYKGFVMNYMMHDLDKPLPELLKMLQTAEENVTKGKGASVLMVQGGKGKPKKAIKIKARTVGKPKSKSTSSATQKPIGGVAKGKCHHCGKAGHWRRNCKTYLATKKKQGTTISSEVYVIEVNMSISSSWVLDTGCGSHICTTMQGLKQSRRLTRGEIELRVGNGAPVAALAIGTYSLVLPSGLMLELNDCLYIPAISRNIICVSCLDKSGFIISIKDKSLSVYRKNVFYANSNMTNGLYVLDLDMPVYNISAKRNKPNGLNQTYLWHCRLRHINEKRISKLHRSGMLESFDLESYDTCESCLLGKMTKSPFTGHGERAGDLLALIHSDVCGPFNTTAR